MPESLCQRLPRLINVFVKKEFNGKAIDKCSISKIIALRLNDVISTLQLCYKEGGWRGRGRREGEGGGGRGRKTILFTYMYKYIDYLIFPWPMLAFSCTCTEANGRQRTYFLCLDLQQQQQQCSMKKVTEKCCPVKSLWYPNARDHLFSLYRYCDAITNPITSV